MKKCAVHGKGGRSPDTPPFFYAGCPTCEAKRAQGLVRGDEGPIRPSAVLRRRTWARQQRINLARAKGLIV